MMHLGIVFDVTGEMKNHRSLLKVLVNPVLRCFGRCIGTVMEDDGGLSGLRFIRCDRLSPVGSLRRVGYDLDPGDFVLRKRLLW